MTRALAVELAPQIRVNGILPGQIESPGTAEYFAQLPDPAEARRRTLESFPLRRLGQPLDIRSGGSLSSLDGCAVDHGDYPGRGRREERGRVGPIESAMILHS